MTDLTTALGKVASNGPPVTAFVRVTGPPNSHMLVGYPGISATVPRVQGKVEIRPKTGISAPVNISYVSIGLYRRESIHPHANDLIRNHLAAPRKESTDLVGKELRLYQCPVGKPYENVLAMDLPFVLIIPFAKGGHEDSLKIPPASIQLPNRTAETLYELVVSVKQGHTEVKKHAFPLPLQRFDTLSTFRMFHTPLVSENSTDHIVTLRTTLPKWSFGPDDPIDVEIKVIPNPDWPSKTKKVSVQKITTSIVEEITYNHEGDEPTMKPKTLLVKKEAISQPLLPDGYTRNLRLYMPTKDILDSDGCLPLPKPHFGHTAVAGFSTTAGLYKIEYFLTVKASLSSAKDVSVKSKIQVTPFDSYACNAEMRAIEEAAHEACKVNQHNPMVPAPTIIRPDDPNAYHCLGLSHVGGVRKLLIE